MGIGAERAEVKVFQSTASKIDVLLTTVFRIEVDVFQSTISRIEVEILVFIQSAASKVGVDVPQNTASRVLVFLVVFLKVEFDPKLGYS